MLKINFKLQVKAFNLLEVFVFLNSKASVTKINGKKKSSVYEIANMEKRNAGWFCCHSHCQWDVFYIYAHGQWLLSALVREASLCSEQW